MSLRWLRVRLQHLPPESATMTALRNANPDAIGSGRDPSEGPWSQLEVLVAALLDETRMARWEAALARLHKGKRPKQPEPTPRPGVTPKRRKPPIPPHAAEWLLRAQNGGAAVPAGEVKPGKGVLLSAVRQRGQRLDRRSSERPGFRPQDPPGGAA